MLKVFFTVVYFVVFLFIINLIFRNTLSAFTDILTIACFVIAFIASVGLACYTVKRIQEKYEK